MPAAHSVAHEAPLHCRSPRGLVSRGAPGRKVAWPLLAC